MMLAVFPSVAVVGGQSGRGEAVELEVAAGCGGPGRVHCRHSVVRPQQKAMTRKDSC